MSVTKVTTPDGSRAVVLIPSVSHEKRFFYNGGGDRRLRQNHARSASPIFLEANRTPCDGHARAGRRDRFGTDPIASSGSAGKNDGENRTFSLSSRPRGSRRKENPTRPQKWPRRPMRSIHGRHSRLPGIRPAAAGRTHSPAQRIGNGSSQTGFNALVGRRSERRFKKSASIEGEKGPARKGRPSVSNRRTARIRRHPASRTETRQKNSGSRFDSTNPGADPIGG